MDCLSPSLYVIDDDPNARDSMAALAASAGIPCKQFDSAEAFLDRYTPSLAGCVLAEICLKKLSGVELQERLAARDSLLSVIFITAGADVRTVVRAMRNGALTVLDKPYRTDVLIDAIRAGFQANAKAREALAEHADARRRIESLTPEERMLMLMVIQGRANKAIACEFGSSRRTVERMRSKLFQKLGVTAAVELPGIVFKLQAGHVGAAAHGPHALHRAATSALEPI